MDRPDLTQPTSPNGAAPDAVSSRFQKFGEPDADSVIEDVAARFRQFSDADATADDADDGFIDDSGEDDLPHPCTSIPGVYFSIDPRPPLVVYICRPRGTRNLFLARREVRRADIHRYHVFLARTRAGKLLLLCVRRPSVSGSDFPAWAAIRRIARRAQRAGGWWAMAWEERVDGSFKLRGGPCPDVKDPVTFPETALEELVLAGFGERVVESADDPRLPELPDLSDAPELT